MLVSRLFHQVHKKWFDVQKKTTEGVQSARDAVFRGGIIVVSAVLIVWLSIFLYTAFYYAYMPSMSYVRPVHLQFKSCNEKKGICSFPSAHVQLTKKQQLLMVGQPYKVNLQLEMPESPANKELGMFMVCAKLRSRDGHLVEDACRSAMLHYRSTLLHMLSTLTFSPMMIFGTTEEKQNVVLELFGNFEEDQNHPVTIIHVEIQSRHIEFYSAKIMITAHLSGIRYLMFHWPVLSAIVGIGTNLFFIALVCALSYFHFAIEEDGADDNFTYEKGEVEEEEEKDIKMISECNVLIIWRKLSSTTSLTEDSAMLEDPAILEDPPKSFSQNESIHSSDPVMGQPSYIQEISTLIAESSAVGESVK